MIRASKKDKDGVRSVTPPFRYIDTEMYLGHQLKWSGKKLGLFCLNEDGSKSGGAEGPETAIMRLAWKRFKLCGCSAGIICCVFPMVAILQIQKWRNYVVRFVNFGYH